MDSRHRQLADKRSKKGLGGEGSELPPVGDRYSKSGLQIFIGEKSQEFYKFSHESDKLRKGAITLAARQYIETILRIWKRTSENNCLSESNAVVDSLEKQNCERKCKDYGEKFRHTSHRRGFIRSVGHAIEIPKSTSLNFEKKEIYMK
ncbi:hypothetical protein TNCV_327061 [Trichonephila clavipes]|nr:hypothetical protein TNCV_327061 [Trichonephila clavipes]